MRALRKGTRFSPVDVVGRVLPVLREVLYIVVLPISTAARRLEGVQLSSESWESSLYRIINTPMLPSGILALNVETVHRYRNIYGRLGVCMDVRPEA